MDTAVIRIDGETGLMFVGFYEGTVAFVPAHCILAHGDSGVFIDEALYLASGWAEKNMLFSPIGCGSRLMPRDDQPPCVADDPRVDSFIQQACLFFEVHSCNPPVRADASILAGATAA